VGGFVAIGILSRIVHSHTDSREIPCAHSHDDGGEDHPHSRANSHASRSRARRPVSRRATESTPLIENGNGGTFGVDGAGHSRTRKSKPKMERRPSMIEVRDRLMSFVKDTKTNCDSTGPCYGYAGLCGQQCFKQVKPKTPEGSHRPSVTRHSLCHQNIDVEDPNPIYEHLAVPNSPVKQISTTNLVMRDSSVGFPEIGEASSEDEYEEDLTDHHHHIFDNPYTDISFQTSVAIALHKLPEGFMTYATNHANPELGFSVFMALFVHNITEGFALALPIYLASRSRLKALSVAAVIGGAAQPLGAGVAALWFKIAGEEGHKPGSTAYGVMFAITAGVMTSVALMLFKEAMDVNHNRDSCIYFAFLGMSIMALSNALTS